MHEYAKKKVQLKEEFTDYVTFTGTVSVVSAHSCVESVAFFQY